MGESRRVIRVFLASPGDLSEERKRAKAIADEQNDLFAEAFNCQFQLVGWEDTVSVFGRPQSTINQELERCEIFIGLMWRKWGTPPAIKGQFTSGFEEEFRTTLARRRSSGRPEMSMFFKSIADEYLKDPGEQLKQVQAFRRELEDSKEILFQEFGELDDFDKKFRACLARYQTTVLREAESFAHDAQQPRGRSLDQDEADRAVGESNPFSAEGTRFLLRFANAAPSVDTIDELSELDVARLRMIASLVGKPSNDATVVGPHDANLIYLGRESLSLGVYEKRALFHAGLHSFTHENTPVWFWWAQLNETMGTQHTALTTLARDEIAVQAFQLMRHVGHVIDDTDALGKDFFKTSWFGSGSADAVRVAAMDYLGDLGSPEDIPQIRIELDRNNSQTIACAAKAVVQISLRQSRSHAVRSIVELRPSSLPEQLTAAVFSSTAGIKDDELTACLDVPDAAVRRNATSALLRRGKLTPASAELLLADDDAQVRKLAVIGLSETPLARSLEDARKIIVRPRKSISGLLSANDPDSAQAYEEYKNASYMALPLAELRRLASGEGPYEIGAYLALVERSFGKLADQLRADVDDAFQSRFDRKVGEYERRFGLGSKPVEGAAQLKVFTTNRQTSSALRLLCSRRDPEDLSRIRRAVKADIDIPVDSLNAYLSQHGEWSDIDLIADAVAREDRRRGLLIGTSPQAYRAAAATVYKVGKHRFAQLLQHERLGRLLPYVLAGATQASMRNLPDASYLRLFANSSSTVRKVAALRAASSLSHRRLLKLYGSYASAGARFYNVVFWLDAGTSLTRDQLKRVESVALHGFR